MQQMLQSMQANPNFQQMAEQMGGMLGGAMGGGVGGDAAADGAGAEARSAGAGAGAGGAMAGADPEQYSNVRSLSCCFSLTAARHVHTLRTSSRFASSWSYLF